MNINLPWNEPDFVESWSEWEQYRKERRLPKYVPSGLTKTLTHLKNISGNSKDTAIKIITQSMEQNYAGLFPLKITNGTYQQSPSGINGTATTRNKRNNGAYQLLSDLKEELASGDAEGI